MTEQVKQTNSSYGALPLLAARITVYLIAMLAVLKLAVGIGVGSIAIVSEGIHTSVDLVAGLIALYTLRAAVKPPDKDHPYGHGKIENLMGLIQAGFIIVPAGYIIYRAVHHLIFHRDSIFGEHLEGLDIGIGVMILTIIVNICLGLWLRHVYRKTNSEAIRANAFHQFADLYTSVGVVGALFLVRATGNVIFDPIIAIVVALYAIFLGWKLMSTSAAPLLDREVDPEIQERITEIINRTHPNIVDFHRLRTRQAGRMIFADIHILFCREATIELAHNLMDLIENDIERQIGNVDITAHAEPCTDDCEECPHPGGRLWANGQTLT